MLTVVGRSTTIGIVGTFIYMFVVEAIALGVLGGLGDPSAHFRNLVLGHNAAAVVAANRIGSDEYYSLAFRETPLASDLPNPWLATLVLAGYCALFLIIAYYVFQRRDLTTESGGN
jgi:ABC-type transport system involved in multi-copper enzyme maturation permease subunit